nr:PREDICTED: tubulin polyglutamylase TTLL5 [Lepisosteus oculatus]XP_015205809.1 PREDICTED: tubulin polyglutamylase TTLL5 [Lepisosteus oculatus]
MPTLIRDKEDSESSSEDEQEDHPCIAWSGSSRKIPILVFHAEAIVTKDGNIRSVGERYNLAYKIVRTESRLVRSILTVHGFHEVHPNSNDFNLMWTGSHLKPYLLRNLQDFQKVNHFPRSYELTRKDRLYKNIQRMQQTHGFKNFHIVPQTFVLPSEYQEFCSAYSKDKGPWIIKPVASSRGRGIYLVSNPNQIPLDENILVSRYISNPLLIDDFKFDVRLYVLVTSYEPLVIYLYEEGLARFATVKYDRATKNIKNQFMHLTNYSVNKKSSDYVSCDDPEVEDYGNKWSMSAMLRYLKQEGKDTTSLMSQIEDLVIKALLSAEMQIATACKMFVPYRNNCFELYGFDVLIDTNLKPWLLEVNLSPSLACDAPLDLKIKASMISDMFTLVGFVCQDPLQKHLRTGRVALEPNSRYQAQKAQRPFSAQQSTSNTKLQQRPSSASEADTNGLKEPRAGKHNGSTLGLTTDELKVLRRIKEEHERRGGFIRIFPSAETWELYGGYLEYKTSMNYMLATRLFSDKSSKAAVASRSRSGLNGHVVVRATMFHAEAQQHVMQYERKLLSLEARKRRRRHFALRSTLGKKKRSVQGHKATSPESTDTEEEDSGEEQDEEDEEEQEKEEGPAQGSLQKLPVHMEKPVQSQLAGAHSPSAAPENPLKGSQHKTADKTARPAQPKPRINLLHILQQGWNLSKVQARIAFSSYLHRVQMRLLAESKGNDSSAWPERDDEQMELVVRFLKRAASNLQQGLKMVLPSRRLPLPDRRCILSQQLGEFIHCYNKETEQMVKKMEKLKDEEHCINPDVFQEFVTGASESDLEEVLTYYTHKNKSASVFLGTGCKSAKPGSSKTSVEEAGNKSQKAVNVSKEEEWSASGSSGSAVNPSASQLKSAESQLSRSPPAALDCNHIHIQPCAPCSVPPSSQPPLLAPSSSQNMGASSPSATLPTASWLVNRARSATVSTQHGSVSQPLKNSMSSNCSNQGHISVSSVPSAVQIYSQKLSRPISARNASHQSNPNRSRPGSALISKEPDAPSNQKAIATALQRLAEKQAERQYSASSHISLLTQHLSNLNLASGASGRGSFALNPGVRPGVVTPGPLRAVRSDTTLTSGLSSLKDDDSTWQGETEHAYSMVTGVSPQQRYQPTTGSYQLQFAIQQLQQQKLQSRQLLDHSRARHQAILAPQPAPPSPAALTSLSTGASSPWQGGLHSSSAWAAHPPRLKPPPVLAPKPPINREGITRKTATQRLVKLTSTEGQANGTSASAHHVVYEQVSGNSGHPVFNRLFQNQALNNR